MRPSYLAYRLPHQEEVSTGQIHWDGNGERMIRLATFDGVIQSGVFKNIDRSAFHLHRDVEKPLIASKESYLEQGAKVLKLFEDGTLSKLVLSRVKWVERSIDVWSTFDQLCKQRQDAFVYLLSDSVFGTWMGATPEILMQSEGNTHLTHALAGTKRSENKDDWGGKELEEQQMVSDYIVSTIESKGLSPEQSEVRTVTAGPVSHLRTDIRFESSNQETTQQILHALHPTPAVCGLPTALAKRHIDAIETHDRSLYAGYISIEDSQQASTFVNLRCMQIFGDGLALFVGGGWTARSLPEEEWKETENKAETLLTIIQE